MLYRVLVPCLVYKGVEFHASDDEDVTTLEVEAGRVAREEHFDIDAVLYGRAFYIDALPDDAP